MTWGFLSFSVYIFIIPIEFHIMLCYPGCLLASMESPRPSHPEPSSPTPDTMASFKSQLKILLTSQERNAVKRALRRYKEDE